MLSEFTSALFNPREGIVYRKFSLELWKEWTVAAPGCHPEPARLTQLSVAYAAFNFLSFY